MATSKTITACCAVGVYPTHRMSEGGYDEDYGGYVEPELRPVLCCKNCGTEFPKLIRVEAEEEEVSQ